MGKTARRKYQTEFVLNVYSSDPTLVAPNNLDKIKDDPPDVREPAERSNIYLIIKRPRISLVPDSIEIEENKVTGQVAVQCKAKQVIKDFSIVGPLPEGAESLIASDYPHTKMSLLDKDKNVVLTIPVAYMLRFMDIDLEGLDDFEVAYVGQAFGASGNRSAVERLSSHSTLQKILSDISANEPHKEIMLALYQFQFHRFIISMDGRNPADVTGDKDKEQYKRKLESDFSRSMRISLAEAALIRYFEPEYNKHYKREFPHKRHKMLTKLYEFDFAGLCVEASIEDHRTKLFSEKVSPKDHHIANFDLHNPDERKSFFFSSP